MSVVMTREEFDLVFAALEMANNPYTHDDVPRLVSLEAQAWKAVQAAKHRADLGEQHP